MLDSAYHYATCRAINRTTLLTTLLLALAGVWIQVGPANAQIPAAPRIGLSAAQDSYVGRITVEPNVDFKLYAMILGPEDGVPLQQSITEIPWVIHQVCCGAVLTIIDAEFNPVLESVGNPLAGTITTVPTCAVQDSIWLATLTVRMESTIPGSFEWASGPFGSVLDCNAESVFMHGMAVTVTMEDTPTPNEISSWGQIKATYR